VILFPNRAKLIRSDKNKVHTIRIHGPWLYFTAESEGKVKVPGDLSQVIAIDFRGSVHMQRNFGCPTGIESSDQLWLVFESLVPAAEIELNGELLATATQFPAQFEVTKILALRNRIDLRFHLEAALDSESLGGILGEVRLEIRTADDYS
jgi:hypothetical protein